MGRHAVAVEETRMYLGPYRWRLTAFYGAVPSDAPRVLRALADAGCSGRAMDTASRNLSQGVRNGGLAFSNPSARETVVVIGECSSEGEFANTWFHEVYHAASHIAEADGLGCGGEPAAYIGGYIAMRMQPAAARIMCPRCSCRRRPTPPF